MNADEYEQYIRDRIAIAEAVIKTFHIDTSKVLVEEDEGTGSVTLWFTQETGNRYICHFIEYQNYMGIVIYINSRLNEYFPNSRKINKESAEAVVKHIRGKSGTDKVIRIYGENTEGRNNLLVLNEPQAKKAKSN